ncbi:pyruvate dehydrogenase [Parvularcula sp. ZS-1/3]|uniref:Dihydrolipoamide acetyltransferase component of pyruvate dehydrogenase complex n=1 Tax=Parvularcula mediterranea TaxID=2732508 RepID=A0A7Y3RK75_9PROT|nr:2-oxo acid dehydrogenase subunit E2 [Parvularcula mediterranea]NNU15588.1 pyruvate dehydrogenase [Parvularcula mediterranea]
MTTYTIKLPDVGEGVTEAEFVELHVAVGDMVEPDQNLVDVMTDKATVEVPSPRKGKVVWIGAEPGDTVAVGAEIIKIEMGGEGSAEAPQAEEAPAEQPMDRMQAAEAGDIAPAPAPEASSGSSEYVIKLPDVGEGVTEAEIVELHIAVGDKVEPDQNLADVMTDKATVEIPSPRTGTVTWIGAAPGDTVAVGAEIIKLSVSGGAASAPSAPAAEAPKEEKPAAPAPTPAAPRAKPTENPAELARAAVLADGPDAAPAAASAPRRVPVKRDGKPLAAPAVRARAMTKGIDLAEVAGSGPEGRITHEDLDAFSRAPAAPAGASIAPNTDVEEIKVIGLRRKIAEKMQEAKRHIPHITYVDEVDMTATEELRQHMNKVRRADQPKLTVLPFFIKAMVRTLEDFPQMNAQYDDEAGIINRFGAAHIGVATQTDNGLMVPVMRHAETLSVWDMAEEVVRLSGAARDGTAKREELSGSTITITSLGPIGGVTTTPIINRPEVAIVGPNKIQTLPRFNANGQVEARKIMNLSSSFDHRIIDGYEAAEFVQRLKAYLEYPATLFV